MEEARRTSVQSSMTQAQYAFNMYTAFLCESVTPSGPVEQVLLDGEDAENDIAQIVGVSGRGGSARGGVIISGEKGVIVSGPAGREFRQAHRRALFGDGAAHLRLEFFSQALRDRLRSTASRS